MKLFMLPEMTDSGKTISYFDAEPGAVWRCPSAHDRHTVEGRPPCYVIRLPGRAYVFHTNETDPEGNYWDVSGEPPNLTVHPSINDGMYWHGWIKDGELTPDTETGPG